MTMHRDPPRLLGSGSAVDPQLRELLQLASAATPTAAQLEALARKVVMTATPPVAANPVGRERWRFGGTSAAKTSVSVLLVGVSAWLGWRSTQPLDLAKAPQAIHQRTTQASPVPRSAAPAARAASRFEARDVRVADGRTELAVPPPKPRPARGAQLTLRDDSKDARVRAHPIRTRSDIATPLAAVEAEVAAPLARSESEPAEQVAGPPKPAFAVESELRLLHRVQSLLARDPSGALALLDRHAVVYGDSAFAQERDALAIDALGRLGRKPEMRARGRAFLQRFPNSPHRQRVVTWLR